MQAAPMRGVDGLHLHALALQFLACQPRIGAAFGAMSVQHIHTEFGGKLRDLSGSAPIAEAETRHRHARQSERAIVGEPPERHGIALHARIADDPDLCAHLRLAERQVVDVPEQAADGRP